jgi:hypothetical protein
MNPSPGLRAAFALLAGAWLAAGLGGCGKKDAPAAAAESAATNPVPAPGAGAAPAVNQPGLPATTDANASLAAAQAALQARDYERAAVALLAVQQIQQPLTAAQGEALRNQMVQLQQSVANGLASGDPKAKAAADLLRKSTMR